MSISASENVFLSALQPNTSVTTYGLPSEVHLGETSGDEVSRARRVQQQVQMRLAQKSTLPRQNGSAAHYAMSDYGGSSTMKYQTYNPNYSAKSSYMYTNSRTMGPRVGQRSGYSSRSVGPDMAQFHKISVSGGGGGGGFISGGGGSTMYREEVRVGGYQGMARPQMESDAMSLHSMPQQIMHGNPWINDSSDAASLMSDREATLNRHYTQGAINGYSTQMRQGGNTMSSMRRSLSGTLSRGDMMGGGGGDVQLAHQTSYKGPAFRTINRINNRNRTSMVSMTGSMQRQASQGAASFMGDKMDGGFIASGVSSGSQGNLMMPRQGLSRAMSVKSIQSVGRGADIFQTDLTGSMGNFSGINSLDMATAVQHLRDIDPELQVLGAAYIQHECYNDSDAKNEVRRYKGIGDLVRLFNSENQEVQRYATGATRNLIYENMDNKVALIEENGIPQLMEALKEPDPELQKNITGIMWNLSSKDNLKDKLAREVLPELTEKILIPLSSSDESEGIRHSPSEADIFYNTTGCFRNLSSVNEKTRQRMRETPGLVDSLVNYIKASLADSKSENKGVENSVCILRNLSYQLYSEMPPSALNRLEGPSRAEGSGKGEAIGCFTPQSRKTKNSMNQDLTTFSEVSRIPKGVEWLWHPQIIGVYKQVLTQCEINSTTREAAAGALQNITAGDKRWASVLSRFSLEQQRVLPVLLDLLRTNNDLELRSLTGFLRNLSRHARDKNDMATKVVNHLVTKLPVDGHQKEPSSDVVVNICGVLNNLVTSSPVAARDISFFDGLPKLFAIKETHDTNQGKMKASKAAATVLSNMFQYKKLHKEYKQKGYQRRDFVDTTL
ncbi:plakophilin-3-like [Neosynchiropus ocellatus]